jgi:hypothetical protein
MYDMKQSVECKELQHEAPHSQLEGKIEKQKLDE